MYLSACYLVVGMTMPLLIERHLELVASSPGHSHVFNVTHKYYADAETENMGVNLATIEIYNTAPSPA